MGGTTILPAAEEPACSPENSSSLSSSGNLRMLKKRNMSYSELKWTEAPLEAPTDLAESFHEVIDAETSAAPTKRLPLEAATTALLVVVSSISKFSLFRHSHYFFIMPDTHDLTLHPLLLDTHSYLAFY